MANKTTIFDIVVSIGSKIDSLSSLALQKGESPAFNICFIQTYLCTMPVEVNKYLNSPINLANFSVHPHNPQSALKAVASFFGESLAPCASIFFVNAYSSTLVCHNPGYRHSIQNASLALPDGISVALPLRFRTGKPIGRVAGPDFALALLNWCEQNDKKAFFLGGKNEQQLVKIRQFLQKKNLDKVWAGGYAPPFGPWSAEVDEQIFQYIAQSQADVLLVGLGAPRQEIWIESHRNKITCRCALGVGAAFDFYAGYIPRAPRWIQKIGMEWLFRLMQDPRRLWKRYLLGNLVFLKFLLFPQKPRA